MVRTLKSPRRHPYQKIFLLNLHQMWYRLSGLDLLRVPPADSLLPPRVQEELALQGRMMAMSDVISEMDKMRFESNVRIVTAPGKRQHNP
ncbi:hypothetical protein CWS02_10390 [Enterobacter sp. EA-1]|nr:hypothetical protein CWS02_10390 [Enterobacter sp. EA-1]